MIKNGRVIAKVNRPAITNREEGHLVHGGDRISVERHEALGVLFNEAFDRLVAHVAPSDHV